MAVGVNGSSESVMRAIIEGACTAIEAGNVTLKGNCHFDNDKNRFVWPTGGQLTEEESPVEEESPIEEESPALRDVNLLSRDEAPAVNQTIVNRISEVFQGYIAEKNLNAIGDQERLKCLTQLEGRGLEIIDNQAVIDGYVEGYFPLKMLKSIRDSLPESKVGLLVEPTVDEKGRATKPCDSIEKLVEPAVDKKGRATKACDSFGKLTKLHGVAVKPCDSIEKLTELYGLAVSGRVKNLRIKEGKGGIYQAKYTPILPANAQERSLTKQETKCVKDALIGLMKTHKSGAVTSEKGQMMFALDLGQALEFDDRPKQIDRAEWRSKPYAKEAKAVLSALSVLVNEKKPLSVGQAIGLTQYLNLVNESIKPPNDTDITANLVLEPRPELQLTCQNRKKMESNTVTLPLEGIDVATARDDIESQDSENPLVVLHTEILKGRFDREVQYRLNGTPPVDKWVESELALATDKGRNDDVYKERHAKAARYLKDARLNGSTCVGVTEKPYNEDVDKDVDKDVLVATFDLSLLVTDGSEEIVPGKEEIVPGKEEEVIELEFSNRIASNGEMRANNLKQALVGVDGKGAVFGSLEELFKRKFLSASDPTISGTLSMYMSRLTEDDLAGLNKAERKAVFENLKALPVSTVKNRSFASKPNLTYGDVFAAVPPLSCKEAQMTARPDFITKQDWSEITRTCREIVGGKVDESDVSCLGQKLEGLKIHSADQMISVEEGARLWSTLSQSDEDFKYVKPIIREQNEGNQTYSHIYLAKKEDNVAYPPVLIAKFPGTLPPT